MRIHPAHIKSVFYIYGSEDEARKGAEVGASGFFVGIPKATDPKDYFVYAVTNVHVIGAIKKENKTPVIRFNTDDGQSEILSVPFSAWKYHPAGDDVAICQIELPENKDVGVVQQHELITPELLKPEAWHIGPGDTTYMIGKFYIHGGKKLNTPTVRYGNISLNPDVADKIPNPLTGHDDEVFLVESRSISGYSGSPVFVLIPPYDERSIPEEVTSKQHSFVTVLGARPPTRFWLLGIDIGHTRAFSDVGVKNAEGELEPYTIDRKRLQSEYNTGIMRIAPAWKIQELLDDKDFDMARKQDTVAQQKNINNSYTLDNVVPSKATTHDLSREEFMSKLKKVSRKITPSESAPAKPRT